MDFAQCRALILQRLHDRDKQTAQFERFFRQYERLADQYLELEAKNNRILAAQAGRGRSFSVAGMGSSDELDSVRQELADLYKMKAQNDQQLIEANNRLAEMERQLRSTQLERDTALSKVEVLKQELEKASGEVGRLKEDNQCLLDEHIALQAAYNSMEANYVRADQERAELIVRMKELKEKEISLVNEMNERELQIQLKNIQSQLAEASRPNPVLDAKAFELLTVDEVPEIASPSTSSNQRERMQSYGDTIPERCRMKFECNDMGEVNDVMFHPNGKYFFTGGMDKKVKMWMQDHDSCTKKAEFTGANQGITRLDLDSECRHILASSNDFAIRVWSLEDQRLRFTFTGHSDKVTTARFFNSGRSVASGSNDRTIKLWDTSANRCLKTFFPGSTVCDLVTNERGYGVPLISSHFDKNIRFWDTRVGDSPANILKMSARVTSLNVTSDCQSLLCSARDETLTLIDLRNYGTMHIYSAEQYRTSSDFSRAVISSADNYVAAGSADGTIFVWNLMSTRLEKVLYKGGHEGAAVLSLAWHPGGHMLLSGDKRRTVCLWR